MTSNFIYVAARESYTVSALMGTPTSSGGSGITALIGIAIGCAVAALICIFVICIRRKWKRERVVRILGPPCGDPDGAGVDLVIANPFRTAPGQLEQAALPQRIHELLEEERGESAEDGGWSLSEGERAGMGSDEDPAECAPAPQILRRVPLFDSLHVAAHDLPWPENSLSDWPAPIHSCSAEILQSSSVDSNAENPLGVLPARRIR